MKLTQKHLKMQLKPFHGFHNILNETNDAEKAYNGFLEMFTNVYEANFPLKRKK
jgi:hypothetical protein